MKQIPSVVPARPVVLATSVFAVAMFLGMFQWAPSASALTDTLFRTTNTWWNCKDTTISSAYPCRTDNSTLTVHRQNTIVGNGRTNIAYTLNHSYDATDLNVVYQGNPVYSGSAETDLIYQAGSGGLSAGTLGIYWCNDAVSLNQCDQGYIRFRKSQPSKHLACHETGHGVGLLHGNNTTPMLSKTNTKLGCMVTPVNQTILNPRQLNIANINGNY